MSFSDCMKAVATGIQKGFENAKAKYKDLLAQFEQGFVAGAMASLTTTLINIFITTDKNMVRYIRQGYTTVVQVGNILLINPNDLLLGDQLKTAMVALTTGASVIAGTAVGNQIAKTPLGKDEHVGVFVQNFCASLVSGLISCTLLIMIDRSEFIRKVVERLNAYGSVEHEIRDTSEAFIALAAEIAQYDMTEFTDQVTKLDGFTRQMLKANDDELPDCYITASPSFTFRRMRSGRCRLVCSSIYGNAISSTTAWLPRSGSTISMTSSRTESNGRRRYPWQIISV